MKNTRFPLLLITPLMLVIAACSEQKTPAAADSKPKLSAALHPVPKMQVAPRWYDEAQVARGNKLFQANCAECHKPDASGAPDWKQTNAEGKLPPPPLNGTAHAWHHPMPLLQQIVRNGGIPMGGSMPAFKDKLTIDQINDILAWVQSHWPDQIYTTWMQINQKHMKSKS
ncbi:c-type cytochrome [Thiolapillus brandeum]|uniref:Cytochrome c, class I n=1 Tax=Thiolapillus brandeum TaxID=1076588 RepID=A0A7U6GK24_9GAMM|nr:c-type cytochrome [Thiolapillus brandeum]BAO45073.1 cytochrome c, class I [Thiolapillus brandeum]